MKTCTRCGEEKPLSEFHRHGISKDGHRPDCKPCRCAQNRRWSEMRRDDPTRKTWDQRMHEKYPGVFGSVTAHRNHCRNPNSDGYKHYGGRGIRYEFAGSVESACELILNTLGPRPAGHTLDRIDVNGHYEIANLRWATHEQQARNRRTRPTAAEWVAVCDAFPLAAEALAKVRATAL